MNTYNRRQLKRMLESLIDFEKKKIDLNSLLSNLNFLYNVIDPSDIDFKKKYFNEMEALEIINAISIVNNTEKEDQKEQELLINQAIQNLKKTINLILEDYEKKPDLNVFEKAVHISSDWLMCPKCTETWESHSVYAMVICPACDSALHNPWGKFHQP